MRPNFLLLLLDTQRVDRLSCYGYHQELSPNIDNLAKFSTKFNFAIAPSQWTLPSHASIFTGLYPAQHTVTQMDSILPDGVDTLAKRLERSGYWTEGFSHNPLIGAMPNGLIQGFQRFQNYDFLGAGLLAFHLSESINDKWVLAHIKRRIRYLLAETLGYSQETALNNLAGIVSPAWKAWLSWRGHTKYAQIRQSLNQATNILNQSSNQQESAFVFVNLMGTHIPYAPPRWALNRHVAPAVGHRSVDYALQQVNRWQVDVANWLEMPENLSLTLLDAVYNAEVSAQDAEIGFMLENLRAGGALENTIVVIVADHGDHLGEKQRVNHAFGLYNELIRVPLLIYDEKGWFSQGNEISTAVSTRRIFHTILTLAGIANDAEKELSLTHPDHDDTVLSEGEPLNWAIQRLEQKRPGLVAKHNSDKPTNAIWDKNHKLIWQSGNLELYNIKRDIKEERNVASSEQVLSLQLLEELKSKLNKLEPVADQATNQVDDSVLRRQLKALGYLE